MLSEPVIIRPGNPGFMSIEPDQAFACRRCALKPSCGQYLLMGARRSRHMQLPDKMLPTDAIAGVGSGGQLYMQIAGRDLVKISLLLYLLPLLLLLAAVFIAGALLFTESLTVIFSFIIFGLSFYLLHKYIKTQDPAALLKLRIEAKER